MSKILPKSATVYECLTNTYLTLRKFREYEYLVLEPS